MGGKTESAPAVQPQTATNQGGPFCRRVDKRLVKQVLNPVRVPTHWVPMDVTSTECKVMEVRKYSAEYHEVDTKFRKPNLELITAYAVQNPFLFGAYDLRREQIKMQLSGTSMAKVNASFKEKFLFFPTTFEDLDSILRNGFSAGHNMDRFTEICNHHVKFYSSSVLANEILSDRGNPRVMIVARVSVVLCHLVPEDVQGASSSPPQCPFESLNNNSKYLAPDTLVNKEKNIFYKLNINEMYPDHILVYRDLEGPNDERSSRISRDLFNCYVSYRAGTRYNPEEMEFKGKQHRADKARAAKKAVAAKTAATLPSDKDQDQITSLKSTSLKKKKKSFLSMITRKSSSGESKSSLRDSNDERTQDGEEIPLKSISEAEPRNLNIAIEDEKAN